MHVSNKPDNLPEACDDLRRFIGNGRRPKKRREMVLAERIEVDVCNGDQPSVIGHMDDIVEDILSAYPYDATDCPVCPITASLWADNWITSDRKGWLFQRVLNSTNTS